MNIDRIGIKGKNDNDFVMLDYAYEMYAVWRTLSAPEVVTNYEEIPGMNGALDCSEEFDEVFYRMRTLDIGCICMSENWHAVYQDILSRYHGQEVQIIFSNDPAYYWAGRLNVSDYDEKSKRVNMTALVYPYKFRRERTVITETVNGSGTVVLHNGRMPVDPEVTISAATTLAWGSYSKAISSSSYPATFVIAGLRLAEGDTTVTITGNTTVTFSYRQGAL